MLDVCRSLEPVQSPFSQMVRRRFVECNTRIGCWWRVRVQVSPLLETDYSNVGGVQQQLLHLLTKTTAGALVLGVLGTRKRLPCMHDDVVSRRIVEMHNHCTPGSLCSGGEVELSLLLVLVCCKLLASACAMQVCGG